MNRLWRHGQAENETDALTGHTVQGIVVYTTESSGKTMNFSSLNSGTKTDIVSRLKRIEGQARGILGMIEKDGDCGDILTQISALSSASRSVGVLIVRGCMDECASLFLEGKDSSQIEEKVADMAEAISRFIAIK